MNDENLEKFLKSFNDKLENLSSILQNFGLDLITKLGKNESKLKMLTDKIDNLAEATIDIKSFSPILSKIVDKQKTIETELDLLKSLIQKSNSSPGLKSSNDNIIERDETITKKFVSIENEFITLKKEIDDITDSHDIIKILEKIKEDIFELTGGHRILYDISQVISALGGTPFDEELKGIVKEKIGFWINKIK